MTEAEPEQCGNVIEALALCIRDVKAVGKDGFNDQQKFHFRGVDAVVNAVHPVLARYRVVFVPHAVERVVTAVTSKSGSAGRVIDVKLTYRVYGPGGRDDYIDATVLGESADWGDKATAKAFSVAYRIVLLQVLNLPTDDPDPDETAFEHVTSRAAQAAQVPDLPQEVADAREAVRGAWAFLYGTFNQEEAATAFTKWGGGVLVEADGATLRRFAAYLSTLTAEAGGNPRDMPSPADRPQDEPTDTDTRPMSGRQRGMLFALMGQMGKDDKGSQLTWINKTLGTEYESRSDITAGDAKILIDALQKGIDAPPAGEPA